MKIINNISIEDVVSLVIEYSFELKYEKSQKLFVYILDKYVPNWGDIAHNWYFVYILDKYVPNWGDIAHNWYNTIKNHNLTKQQLLNFYTELLNIQNENN